MKQTKHFKRLWSLTLLLIAMLMPQGAWAEYYDMNGRKLNSLQKGVNIVKYGNGKTVKVSIK